MFAWRVCMVAASLPGVPVPPVVHAASEQCHPATGRRTQGHRYEALQQGQAGGMCAHLSGITPVLLVLVMFS